MALVDATLTATPNLAILFFADFVDLPLRGAFAPCPIHVPTGLTDSDADCAGFSFDVLDSKILQVGAVSQEDGGTDSMGFSLQADPADTDLMSAIEDPSLYAGRKVRMWLAIYDPDGTAVVDSVTGVYGAPVTELRPLYRGYMTQPTQEADANSYTITMQAENFVALLSAAQNRTYIQSKLYDSGDNAGAVRMGGNIPAAPGGGGTRFFNPDIRMFEQ